MTAISTELELQPGEETRPKRDYVYNSNPLVNQRQIVRPADATPDPANFANDTAVWCIPPNDYVCTAPNSPHSECIGQVLRVLLKGNGAHWISEGDGVCQNMVHRSTLFLQNRERIHGRLLNSAGEDLYSDRFPAISLDDARRRAEATPATKKASVAMKLLLNVDTDENYSIGETPGSDHSLTYLAARHLSQWQPSEHIRVLDAYYVDYDAQPNLRTVDDVRDAQASVPEPASVTSIDLSRHNQLQRDVLQYLLGGDGSMSNRHSAFKVLAEADVFYLDVSEDWVRNKLAEAIDSDEMQEVACEDGRRRFRERFGLPGGKHSWRIAIECNGGHFGYVDFVCEADEHDYDGARNHADGHIMLSRIDRTLAEAFDGMHIEGFTFDGHPDCLFGELEYLGVADD